MTIHSNSSNFNLLSSEIALQFAISLWVVIFIFVFIKNEYSIDTGYPDVKRIYKLVSDENRNHGYQTTINDELEDYINDQVPEVEQTCRYLNLIWDNTLSFNNQSHKCTGDMKTESSLFKCSM